MDDLRKAEERYRRIAKDLRLREGQETGREAMRQLNNIMRGAIVGAPAVEGGY